MLQLLIWLGLSLTVLSFAYWLFAALASGWIFARVPVVAQLPLPQRKTWPKVVVIVPACNEEAAVEEALRSKLADGYPNLEVVLVNDRSTDRTGPIAEAIAQRDARVRVIHVTELPPDWLGKVHAMQQGVAATESEWILLSDADVHLAPGTLQRLVDAGETRHLDQVACLPELWPTTFLLDVVLCTFVRFFCIAARLWAVSNPRSSASCGVGAFNLVRRTALEKCGGLEALRMTVVDDVGLGQLIKKNGLRSGVYNGRDCVGLHFYRSLGEMARGVEKNVPALGNFSLLRLLLRVAIFLITETTLFAAVWLTSGYWRWLCVAGIVIAIVTQARFCHWLRRPLLPAFLVPLGALAFAVVVVRAGLLETWRGGIIWRGTLYPTAQLKSQQRFDFL